MKRTIKFRGYNLKNNKWIYGYYLVNRGQHFVVEDGIANPLNTWEDYLVEEETIGQFTGLLDKNGVEIYEGDILIINNKPTYLKVYYNEKEAAYFAKDKSSELRIWSRCINVFNVSVVAHELINRKEPQ